MDHTQENKPIPQVAASFPVEVKLVSGKTSAWCTCGLSEKQPFCDGKHKSLAYEKDGETIMPFKSMKFVAEKDDSFWFCQCKQTKNPPFCDGTHNQLKK
ncbi:MAG: CDGSH iron-sulfur domain-containing protein [Bacteroidota bacterium]